MTSALLISSQTKNILIKKCLGKSKESLMYRIFIVYRNTYNRLKRISKQNYYTNELAKYKHNTKQTWGRSILNALIGKNNKAHGISESFKINDNISNDKKIISNKFCEYFSEIGIKYASDIPPAQKPFTYYQKNNHNAQSMFMSPTDEVEVCNIITSMKGKTSSGHDYLSYNFYPRAARWPRSGHTRSIQIFCKNYGYVWRVPSTITALSSDYNSYCHSNSSYADSLRPIRAYIYTVQYRYVRYV